MNIETVKFLNKLKNNSLISKLKVTTRFNKLSCQIAFLLYNEGYILSYRQKDRKKIDITLRNFNENSILKNLKICSSPSKTQFLSWKQISKLKTDKNLYAFSTDEGIISGELCKKKKKGGILLFYC